MSNRTIYSASEIILEGEISKGITPKIFNEPRAIMVDWIIDKLADIMKQYLEKDYPVSKAETYARASKDYQDYVKNMAETRKEANKARVAYDSLKVLASLRQSQHVTKRAEMKFI